MADAPACVWSSGKALPAALPEKGLPLDGAGDELLTSRKAFVLVWSEAVCQVPHLVIASADL